MNDYVDAVTNIIMTFQWIEEALKNYIIEANKKIRERVEDIIPFRYSYEWVSKDALGKLVDKFSKINSNKALIKNLVDLTTERNKMVHRSFLLTIEDKKNNYQKFGDIKSLRFLNCKLHDVLQQIGEETEKICS